MSKTDEILIETLKSLPAEQRAEVEDFVEFLATKAKKQAAWNRLLAVAPALQAAGVEPMSEEELDAEIEAARAERRVRNLASAPDADRS